MDSYKKLNDFCNLKNDDSLMKKRMFWKFYNPNAVFKQISTSR